MSAVRYADHNGRIACPSHVGHYASDAARRGDRMINTPLTIWLRADTVQDGLACESCEAAA